MSNGITVIKRNGDKDSLNLEKVHKMVEHACEGLAGVSASQVEISSGYSSLMVLSQSDTRDTCQVCIRSYQLENPNYQYVASRLLLFDLRKQLNGSLRRSSIHTRSCQEVC